MEKIHVPVTKIGMEENEQRVTSGGYPLLELEGIFDHWKNHRMGTLEMEKNYLPYDNIYMYILYVCINKR